MKKKPWKSAALPGGEIPDIKSELEILGDSTGSIRFAKKEKVIIVPTILPGFNRASRAGGAPVGCIMTIHGPSKGGKTAFCLALVRSFQLQGHFTIYIDAEHSLDESLVSECGVDADQMEYFAPRDYEQTAELVERYIENFEKGRKKNKINKNRCLLFIVDSISKLVPKSELKTLSEIGKGYPLRALMNTAWLDKLTPVVGALPILFVILAHEKVNLDAGPFQKGYHIKGGGGIEYDSTIVIRVQAVAKRRREVKRKKVIVGHVHEGIIEKNKVGVCSDRFRFVMGQGRAGYPIGFDYCEQIVEEVKLRGDDSPIIRASGGKWSHKALPEGISSDAAFVDWLRENPDVVDKLIVDLNDTAIDAVVSEEEEEG